MHENSRLSAQFLPWIFGNSIGFSLIFSKAKRDKKQRSEITPLFAHIIIFLKISCLFLSYSSSLMIPSSK